MSKPITVSSCAYVHETDIDPERHIDAKPIHAALDLCVARAARVLEQPLRAYGDLQRGTIASIFESMKATHAAIRTVLKSGANHPQSVDALALARVSLEGLYTLSLMFEDSAWVDRYLKDGWKKQYSHFLLQREETKKLHRFDDFSKNIAPSNLDAQRGLLGVSDAEQATIDHEELGTPLPSGMAGTPIPRFPGPSGVINKLPAASDKRRMLERLYPEYVYLCTFAHGLPDANIMKRMFNKDPQCATCSGS